MSKLCDVTVTLSNTPTKALHDALTKPVTDDGQALSLIDMSDAGGHRVYTGAVYAACFNHVLLSDLEAHFLRIPVGAYGVTQGIVIIDHENENGLMANRIGYVPPPKGPHDF